MTLEEQWDAELARAADVMARDFLPLNREPVTTDNPCRYWLGCTTLELVTSADEYEQAVNEGRFADDLDAGAALLVTASDMRTEIARRQNEHWHPGSIRHSHARGQEPHRHEETP